MTDLKDGGPLYQPGREPPKHWFSDGQTEYIATGGEAKMTKLDEAVEAAAREYDDECAHGQDHRTCMKAAGQAFVKAAIPPPIKSGEVTEKGVGIFSPDYEDGYNACRAETLKNAGVE